VQGVTGHRMSQDMRVVGGHKMMWHGVWALFSPAVACLPYLRADAAQLRHSASHSVLLHSYHFCCEKRVEERAKGEEGTTFLSHVP
jgi:hypothetical protein